MKLHLGSGNKYKKGWTNVDLYAEKADVREDLRTVDFPAGSIERILFIHTIEHLNREDGVSLLRRCFEWLKPGGFIEIETPDKKKCENLIREGFLLDGAKGLMGGRSKYKDGWHFWLVETWIKNRKATISSFWKIAGEQHLHVWVADWLAREMMDIGYGFSFERPQHHGRRHKRDMRIVGTKPERRLT